MKQGVPAEEMTARAGPPLDCSLAAVVKPFGDAQREQQTAEGEAHQRDDQGKPS